MDLEKVRNWFHRSWRQLLGACILLFAAARLPELCLPISGIQEQIAADILSCVFWFVFLAYLVWWLLDSRRHTEESSEN